MALPGREISVGWALFLWDGRIGRRVFILGTLFWMMANAAVIAFVTGSDDISPGSFSLFLTTASLSLVSLLMLGTKRLHDIGIELVKNADGVLGAKFFVGGGMGRTPMIAPLIKDFVPIEDFLSPAAVQRLLAYVESNEDRFTPTTVRQESGTRVDPTSRISLGLDDLGASRQPFERRLRAAEPMLRASKRNTFFTIVCSCCSKIPELEPSSRIA